MQFYRPAIERLAKALKEKDESLTNEQATVAQLKAQLAAQTESMTGEMAKHDQAAKKAEQDKQGEIDKFGADRKKLEDDLAKMDGTVKQTRKDSDAAQTDLNAKLAAATGGREEGDRQLRDGQEEARRDAAPRAPTSSRARSAGSTSIRASCGSIWARRRPAAADHLQRLCRRDGRHDRDRQEGQHRGDRGARATISPKRESSTTSPPTPSSPATKSLRPSGASARSVTLRLPG